MFKRLSKCLGPVQVRHVKCPLIIIIIIIISEKDFFSCTLKQTNKMLLVGITPITDGNDTVTLTSVLESKWRTLMVGLGVNWYHYEKNNNSYYM